MNRALIGALAVLLVGPMVHASGQGQTVLDVDGGLLLGTAGVGIGEVDDGEPVPDQGLAPVSHVAHPFTLTRCDRFLAVDVLYESLTRQARGEEDALLQVEIQDADSQTVEAWLVGDGSLEVATQEAHPPGRYTLDLFHLAGGPLMYNATVTAFEDPAACP